MPLLVVTHGSHAGEVLGPIKTPCPLGRGVSSTAARVFRQNERVSRQHAEIFCEDNRYFLRDLESRNGTSLNGRPVERNEELRDGDRIVMGGVVLRFVMEGDTARLPRLPETSEQSKSAAGRVVFDDDGEEDTVSVAMVQTPVSPSGSSADPARTLPALLGLLRNLGASLDLDTTLNNLLKGLFEVFPQTDHGIVATCGEGGLDPFTARAVRSRDEEAHEPLRVSRTLLTHVAGSRQAVLSEDARQDARFAQSSSISASDIRSLMCVPLLDLDGQLRGIIQLDTAMDQEGYEPSDLEVFAGIAPTAALALLQAEQHQLALRRQAIDRDLRLARKVQLDLLPNVPPDTPGYDFFSFYDAAFEVGGDYFDYIPLPDNRIAVILADVAGKGISAALLAAKVSGEMKYLLTHEARPEIAVARMNNSICTSGVVGRFVTAVVLVLDPQTHRALVITAGHPSPLLRKHGRPAEEFGGEQRGAALGMFQDQTYEAAEFPFEPGDLLLLFSDGLSEATRADDTLYGRNRLREQASGGPADIDNLGRELLRDIERFVDGQSQSDDMCLLGLQRTLTTS